MSMTQALARVGEIRTEIVALHDVVTTPGPVSYTPRTLPTNIEV